MLALLSSLVSLAHAQDEYVLYVPALDTFRLGVQQVDVSDLSDSPDRSATFGSLGGEWRLFEAIEPEQSGIEYDDRLWTDMGGGWMSSDPYSETWLGDETRIGLRVVTGYEGLIGYKTGGLEVHGGLRLGFDMVMVGGTSGYAITLPLVAKVRYDLGPFDVEARAWASAWGERRATGAIGRLVLADRVVLEASADRVAEMMVSSAFYNDESASVRTLGVNLGWHFEL